MMHEQAVRTGGSSEEAAGKEQDHFRWCSADHRIPDRFSSGLCERTASGKRVARGQTGEQTGPASGSGFPRLPSGDPEGLWTGGWHQHASLRRYPGSSQSNVGLCRQEIPGGSFELSGSDHRQTGNGRSWSSERFAGFACEDSPSHGRFLQRTATIGPPRITLTTCGRMTACGQFSIRIAESPECYRMWAHKA